MKSYKFEVSVRLLSQTRETSCGPTDICQFLNSIIVLISHKNISSYHILKYILRWKEGINIITRFYYRKKYLIYFSPSIHCTFKDFSFQYLIRLQAFVSGSVYFIVIRALQSTNDIINSIIKSTKRVLLGWFFIMFK